MTSIRTRAWLTSCCLLVLGLLAHTAHSQETTGRRDVWFRLAPNFGGFVVPDRKTSEELFGSEDVQEVLVVQDEGSSGKRLRVTYRSFFSGRTFLKEIIEPREDDLFWIVRKKGKENRIRIPKNYSTTDQENIKLIGVLTNGVRLYDDIAKKYKTRDDATLEALQFNDESESTSLRISGSPTDADCEPLTTVVRGQARSGAWERVIAVRLPRVLPSPCQYSSSSGISLDWTVGGNRYRGGRAVYLGDGTALIHGNHHVLRVRLADGYIGLPNRLIASMTPAVALEIKQRVDKRLRGAKSLKEMDLQNYFDVLNNELAAEIFGKQGTPK